MDEKIFITPQYTTAQKIKYVRSKLNLTQKEFAMFINCSKATVERWETSEEKITGPICLLLELLEKNPEYAVEFKVPEKKKPIRLWYMHKDTVCTMIDVDEMKREISIKNYTNNIMFRAFGVNECPDYNTYTEFLESRCFPKSRDKLKLVLKDLNLPFYDPFMIIEKTEGRMAEDDSWITIERGNL